MKEYRGSCLCGSVTFEIAAEIQSFVFCHCSRCRKTSGSAHASNLFSKKWDLRWLSGKLHVRTYKLPDSRFVTSFCQGCGSALPLEGESWLMIPAGCLDTEVETKPTGHIHMGSRASWEDDLSDIPKHESFPVLTVPL